MITTLNDQDEQILGKVVAITTLISICLFLFSIIQSKHDDLDFGGFGLISSLRLTYFLATSLLTSSFLILLIYNYKNKYLYTLQIFALISMLFIVPLLLEGTPRFNSNYVIAGEVDYTIRNGFLNSQLIRYHNWPLADILGSTIINLININLEDLLAFTPFVSNLLYLFPLYIIFGKLFVDNKKWLACWLFYLANWLNQDYFSPQNLAFILYIFYMYLIFIVVFQVDGKNKYNYRVLLILISFAIIFTHILSSFLMVINLLLIIIFSKIHTKYMHVVHNPHIRSLFLLVIVIFFAWLIHGADFMISRIITIMVESLVTDATRDAAINLVTTGSEAHNAITSLRIANAALFVLISSVGVLCLAIYEKKIKLANSFMVIFFITATISLIGGKYGGEIIIRILLFSLVPLAYFAVQCINNKMTRVFLIIFILVSPPLHIVSHYGNETIDYTSPNELAGARFFFNYAIHNSRIICPQSNLCDIKDIEKYSHTYELNNNHYKDTKTYIWITRRGIQKYAYFESDESAKVFDEFMQRTILRNNIYSNDNFNLFI